MAQKSTKILIFSTAYLPHIGGAEFALRDITDRIKNVSFDLITAKLDKNLPIQEIIGSVRIFRVGFIYSAFFTKLFFPISGFLKALKIKKQYGQYDGILSLQASQGGGSAWLYKIFNKKIPLVLNIQEGKELEKQGFLINALRGLIIKKSDYVVAISNYLKKYVRNVSAKPEILVIPNGVDLKKFSLNKNDRKTKEIRKNLNISETDFVLISVSRLVKKNGIKDLIKAFSEAKKEIANLKLILAGEGDMEAELKKDVSKFGISEDVKFIGSIDHENVPFYLASADVYIRPSLSEGLGTAFLEAMAVGIPVIATPVGGIADFLKDKETGILCKPGDYQDISDKIKLIARDEKLLKEISLKARDLVEKDYNWERIAEKYEQLFELLKNKKEQKESTQTNHV